NHGTMANSPNSLTPANAVITGSQARIWFDSEFNLPGGFTLCSREGDAVLRYEEKRGANYEGLYYEAAEVARCIAAGAHETTQRRWAATLDTMATLDMIRRAVGIDFAAAGLHEP